MIVSDIKGVLNKLGIRPSKRHGQHFLVDNNIADWMVEQVAIVKNDKVMEIGSGLGILTERLGTYTNNIIAIEKDKRLADYLSEKLSVKIINADALTIDLPEFHKVISNLPYHISSPMTLKLLEQKFDKGILMFQKEFADHLVAVPGTKAYSRISVMTQHKAACKIIKHVSKGNFYPVPKVDSTIVEITPRPPDYEVVSFETFQNTIRILFSHKNRKVRNAIISERKILGMEKQEATRIADELPYSNERPVNLSPSELADIANTFSTL
jgi:16S rRNA (adenine1518-N6/adenine1519-N6)-dimethyltransferase